jgi:hypothetical protein
MVCLNFCFIGDDMCFHSMDCCFNSGVMCDNHVSSPVTTWLKKSLPCSLYRVRKVNALACCFILGYSISNFGTQREHNTLKRSLSYTVSWRSDCKICGKCREGDNMVNRLFSWIFSSTARTKSSLTTDGWPLHGSTCTFLCPSLKCLTHIHTWNRSWRVLHTPYKVDDKCQLVSCFLHSRNGLQTAFHMRRVSVSSWTL